MAQATIRGLRSEIATLREQRDSMYERLTAYEDVDPVTFKSIDIK